MAQSRGDGDVTCVVCLSAYEDPALLVCGHTFCRECLDGICIQSRRHDRVTCPECRQVTNLFAAGVGGLPANIALNRLLDQSGRKTTSDGDKERGPPCSEHPGEFKDMFCDNKACRIIICPACLVRRHHGHCIKTRKEHIMDQEGVVRELGENCHQKKGLILGGIYLVEKRREEVKSAMQLRKEEVEKEYNEKIVLLENEKKALIKKLCFLESLYNSHLDCMRARYDQTIEDIDFKYGLVLGDDVSRVEKEDYNRHVLHREDLIKVIKKPVYKDYSLQVELAAKGVKFHKSKPPLVYIGNIEDKQVEPCVEVSLIKKGLKIIGREMRMPLPMRVVMELDVGKFEAMTALNENTVILAYGCHRNGADSVSVNGNILEFFMSNVGIVAGIAVLGDRKSVVYDGDKALSLFRADGSELYRKCFGVNMTPNAIQSDPHNNVYVIDEGKEISVFTFDARKHKRVIVTEDKGHQHICVTASGSIITSIRCNNGPSHLVVYNIEGDRCSGVTAEHQGEVLLFAMNSATNGFLARLRNNVLRLSFCKVRDNRIDERMMYKELTIESIPINSDSKWHFVCLSSNLLALARDTKLFFIEI